MLGRLARDAAVAQLFRNRWTRRLIWAIVILLFVALVQGLVQSL